MLVKYLNTFVKNIDIRNGLIIIFLVASTIASATDYYISSLGNDTNKGLSSSTPWKSIAKVDSAFSVIKPGDRILFNRGDTFYGTINITKSGTSGSPIVIGAYGTGNDPIITGFTTISGWTNEGSGLYSKVITSVSQTNMVTINGVNTGMGRYPNSAYLTYDASYYNVSISNNVSGDSTDWKGAEAVINKNDWTLDRCLVIDDSGGILTFTNLGTLQNSAAKGLYFIQNDLRCVTDYGEWYHNIGTGKFYMYFGTVDPTTKTVKVATLNHLLYNGGYEYIIIDNIDFTGSINNIIEFKNGSTNCTIENGSITYSGANGIYLPTGCNYILIDNNLINNFSTAGIFAVRGTNNIITNNIIEKAGLIKGSSNIGTYSNGIYLEDETGAFVQYNNIDSCAYNGITFKGNGIEIRNNFINHTVLYFKDGGAIYTVRGDYKGRIIEGNIILNTGSSSSISAMGIYLDEYSTDIQVLNNTVANSVYAGIELHFAHDNVIKNNTLFNNGDAIFFTNWSGVPTIYNNILSENIFFAKAANQLVLKAWGNINDIPSLGMADNNYYARPVDDNLTFFTYQPSEGSKYRTLVGWQIFTGQDVNSHKSPIGIQDTANIDFYYNSTKVIKTITINHLMMDIKGINYSNSITLLPFTSMILLVDPNPAHPVIPVYTISTVENATPSLLEMIYNVSLANTIPTTTAFSVSVNGVKREVNSVVISGNKVQLTLARSIVFGDKVTVSYNKPKSNLIQTPSGEEASSITSQSVKNNCFGSIKSDLVDTDKRKIIIYHESCS